MHAKESYRKCGTLTRILSGAVLALLKAARRTVTKTCVRAANSVILRATASADNNRNPTVGYKRTKHDAGSAAARRALSDRAEKLKSALRDEKASLPDAQVRVPQCSNPHRYWTRQ